MLTKNLKYRRHKIGKPPGSLLPKELMLRLMHSFGKIESGEITFSLIEYDKDTLIESKTKNFSECIKHLNSPTITWINVHGTNDPTVIEEIGKCFSLHPLMLEDIMSVGQRSKIDDYGDTLYLSLQMLRLDSTHTVADDEQVSFILGSNFLITFLQSENDLLGPVHSRLQNDKSKLRARGADYLCYSIIDSLIDSFFLILEKIDKKIEDIEDELFGAPTQETLHKIYRIKREIILLRKAMWPLREVIAQLKRTESTLMHNSTKLYIQDVYDHTIQAIDIIENFRDVSSSMIDIYISSISNKLNEIIKVLTVVSTIFVPITFIASYYGMNVKMPELASPYAYPGVILLMLSSVFGMLYYFRKKGWM